MSSDLVLYVDEALVVANKPAGLPTLVDGYHPEAPYLLGLLQANYGRLWVVHRLDRYTSGVVLFARHPTAHRHLNHQFEKRRVEKTYYALVHGEPLWESQGINLPLRPDGDRRHRTVVDWEKGKPSQSTVRVVERFSAAALLEVVPHSGRPHQIRAHLAAVGHPLVGDALYGGAPLAGLERPALHAWRLALRHPTDDQWVTFCAPLPEDISQALNHLRAASSANQERPKTTAS